MKGGIAADGRPEAVNVNLCSGVIIAPHVVMTAAHCVGGGGGVHGGSFKVTAPNAGGQTAHAGQAWSVGYVEGQSDHADIGLVFLDTSIDLDCYPPLAPATLAFPVDVVATGHTYDGAITTSLWSSATMQLIGTGDAYGLSDHYASSLDVTELGDSGGPIQLLDAGRTIVAVVSTDTDEIGLSIAPPVDLFARVDLQRVDIDARVAEHGGYAASVCGVASGGAGGSGAAGSGGSSGAATSATPSTSSGGCGVATLACPDAAWLVATAVALAWVRKLASQRHSGPSSQEKVWVTAPSRTPSPRLSK